MTRTTRLIQALPLLTALLFHGAMYERWWLVVPVALALVVVTFLRPVTPDPRWPLVVGGLGAALGLALAFVSAPPPGPLPPTVVSPLAVALALLGVLFTATQRVSVSWLSAWVLAVLSTNGASTALSNVALVALAVSSAVAIAWRNRGVSLGPVGALATMAFWMLAAGGGWVAYAGLVQTEGWLMNSLARFTIALPNDSDTIELRVARTERVPLDETPLFELDAPVDRLRTHVFDAFDGHRWFTTPELTAVVPGLPGGGERAASLWMLAPPSRRVPVPEGVTSVEGDQVQVHGGGLVEAADGEGRRLTVRWVPGARADDGPTAATLELPEVLRAELTPLATEVLGSARGARTEAAQLERHFSDGFEYSLDVDLSGSGHPLAVLIRERRAAYCTYFAAAMAVLLRTRGVSTRVIGGYAPSDANPLNGRTLVLARDAHAWVEVWIPEERHWARFDPTPWRSRDQVMGTRPPSSASAAWSVVASWFRRVWSTLRHQPVQAVLAVLQSPVSWAAVALAAAWAIRARWRSARGGATSEKQVTTDRELQRVMEAYRALLARNGVVPKPDETDDELLARVAEVHAHAVVSAQIFIDAYRRERFRVRTGATLDAELAALTHSLELSHTGAPGAGA